MRTSLILVGGNAKRAGGYPKYLFRIGEQSFLERQIEILSNCSEEIFIISRDNEQIKTLNEHPGVFHICDITKGIGPSGGIQAGVHYMKGEYFFVTACDMPLISCEIITFLFDSARGHNGAVPIWEDGRIEPLCAVYKKEAVLEFYRQNNSKRLASLVTGINAKMIQVDELRRFDPELQIFLNINDVSSYENLKKLFLVDPV